jgi:hypothetical protein
MSVDYFYLLLLLLLSLLLLSSSSLLVVIQLNNAESNSNILKNVITNVEPIAYINFRG